MGGLIVLLASVFAQKTYFPTANQKCEILFDKNLITRAMIKKGNTASKNTRGPSYEDMSQSCKAEITLRPFTQAPTSHGDIKVTAPTNWFINRTTIELPKS